MTDLRSLGCFSGENGWWRSADDPGKDGLILTVEVLGRHILEAPDLWIEEGAHGILMVEMSVWEVVVSHFNICVDRRGIEY